MDPAPPRARVWFVDIVRLIASLQMINGHTLDGVMSESLKQGEFFDSYNWCRGLVSVSFLLVAGLAFHLSTLANLQRHLSKPGAVAQRFRRAGTIVLIGYLLYFPWGVLGGDPAKAAASMHYFMAVDILQVIGVSLLALELITVLARDARRVAWISGLIAVALFAAAPLPDKLLTSSDPNFFLNYLTHNAGSRFPLFPWAAFTFTGVAVGAIVLPQAGRTPFMTRVSRLALLTVGAFILQAVIERAPWSFLDEGVYSRSAPAVSQLALASVFAISLFLAIVCHPIKRLPRVLALLASGTLTIYVFHMLVLWAPGVGLARVIGPRLSLPASVGVSVMMLIVTCSFTVWWQARKQRKAANAS